MSLAFLYFYKINTFKPASETVASLCHPSNVSHNNANVNERFHNTPHDTTHCWAGQSRAREQDVNTSNWNKIPLTRMGPGPMTKTPTALKEPSWLPSSHDTRTVTLASPFLDIRETATLQNHNYVNDYCWSHVVLDDTHGRFWRCLHVIANYAWMSSHDWSYVEYCWPHGITTRNWEITFECSHCCCL